MLTVTNTSEKTVQVALRDIILERKEGSRWAPLPHDPLPVLTILYELAPGLSTQLAQPLVPADAIAGTYRFRVLTSESDKSSSADNTERLSNEWRVVPSAN